MQKVQVFLALVFVFSCKTDIAIDNSDLIGKWDIVEAQRNDKPTGTLKDGYFEFLDNGEFVTNITGIAVSKNYELNNSTIVETSGDNSKYRIESILADTIVLSLEKL